jgi:hypothetical protein
MALARATASGFSICAVLATILVGVALGAWQGAWVVGV